MLRETILARRHRQTYLPAGHGCDALAMPNGIWQIFIELLGQLWFVVPEIDLRRATVHVQIDHSFGFASKVRQTGQGWMHTVIGCRFVGTGAFAECGQTAGTQGTAAQPQSTLPEELTARLQKLEFVA